MPTTVNESKWTREAIEEFLRTEQPKYQRIELPHGLATKGDDRSDIADMIFPKTMGGRSMLDVGCFLGGFCIEAQQRGADRVVGVDIDRDRLAQARTIADILGLPIDYRFMDIEEDEFDETFDDVIFLNVLHHVRNPIAVIDRLIGLTRGRLIMEVAGSESERPERLLKRLGANWYVRRAIKNLPLMLVGRNGTPGRRREQKYFYTPLALQHLLMHQRQAFARIEFTPSPFKNRFLCIAHRRQVGRLLLVAGSSGSGKSTLIERLMGGGTKQYSGALGF